MKIVYSAGNRVGADHLISRLLAKQSNEIKIAAHLKSSNSLSHIDWTLDAIYNKYTGCDRAKLVDLFGHTNLPMMGFDQAVQLIQDINDFQPDLIICDYEPIMANIAKTLGVKLWYCSPVHLLDGIKWGQGQIRYSGLLDNTRKTLSKLPKPDRIFVNSPFGTIQDGPELKPGYEWVIPETRKLSLDKYGTGMCVTNDSDRVSELSKILNCIPPFDLVLFSNHKYDLSHLESYLISEKNNYWRAVGGADWMFCTGETSFIADAAFNGVSRLCVAPDLSDPEALLNAILVQLYGLGDDVTQVEYLERYSVEAIEESYSKRFMKKYQCNADHGIKNLHEKIEELCGL